MFVGRYVSEREISISVIVEHMKHIGTIRGFFTPGEGGGLANFSVIWREIENARGGRGCIST